MVSFTYESRNGRPLDFDRLESYSFSGARGGQSNDLFSYTGTNFRFDFYGMRVAGSFDLTNAGGTVSQFTLAFTDSGRDELTFNFPRGASGDPLGDYLATGSMQGFLSGLFGGDDGMSGTSGSDLLRGYAGNDDLQGGGENDTVFGGVGNDGIGGGTGNDYLRGDDGADNIFGGAGNDDINGNRGNDGLSGEDGEDWVVGGQDDDLLYGGNDFDIVYGNLGNDACYGDDGNDWVRGGQGDDSVFGGNGNDWLWGDRGTDTLTGGNGADIFHTFAGAGVDRVTDFKYAEGDRIVIDDKTPYTLAQIGGDAVITLTSGDTVVLVGVQAASLPADWLIPG